MRKTATEIRTYAEAVRYIEEIPRFTKKTSVEHTMRLLDRLGHPEERMKLYHVAGTNGKGSVCAFLASMLQTGKYRCGLFTSPHLFRINERMRIADAEISDAEFLEQCKAVLFAAEELMSEDPEFAYPTYFEILFLMAMRWFACSGAEYAVIETGMGGRLDATNAIRHPLAVILTEIGMDHMQYLGTTIEQIAGEKAGIIKPGASVIYDAGKAESTAVIQNKLKETGCIGYDISRDQIREGEGSEKEAFSEGASLHGGGYAFQYEPADLEPPIHIELSMLAPYQRINAVLAFEAMRVTRQQHGLADATLLSGLKHTSWPCRMEEVLPEVYLDGAHNADGIHAFLEAEKYLQKIKPSKSSVLLFGALTDHAPEALAVQLMQKLLPAAIVLTASGESRSEDPTHLAEYFHKAGAAKVYIDSDPAKAYMQAMHLKEQLDDARLFCVGSLYLAGKIRALIKEP